MPAGGERKAKLWWLDDLGVEAFHRNLDTSIPKHTHDDWQIARGVGRWWYRGGYLDVPPGGMVVVSPGEVHATDGPGESPWDVQNFRVPNSIFETLAEQKRTGAIDAASGLKIIDDPRLLSWFMFSWTTSTGPSSSLERSSALHGLVAGLVDRDDWHQVPDVAESKAIVRAREVLHDCPEQEISLADLAELAGASPCRLNRTFAKAVGLPPHAYQVQLRMRKARSLLLEGAMVAEAAHQAGFADQSHLGRYFKKFGSLPPGEYRRLARNP